MTTYYDSIFTALNNLLTINADDINTSNLNVSNETTMNNATIKNLTITDSLLFPLNFMWSNLINQNPLLTGTNHLVSTNFNNNITQSNGSNQLLDTDIGTISQSEESVIIQSGNQWNQLKQTQVTDLSITGVLTLPPNIVISGALYNDDLIMNNATIQQTAPPSQINTFSATDFYNGDVRMNKNLTMIGGADTLATLKNLHVEGNSNMGLIISPTITDLDSRITTNTNSITTINTNMLLKADTTYVNSQLALKANINNPTFTGNVQSTNIITTGLYIPQSSGGLHFYTLANTISNSSSRIAFSAGNVMFWDNFTPTNIQFRFGSTLITRQTFFNNGDVSITGNILNSPTISTINTNIGLKSDLSYVNAQLLLKDNVIDVNNKLLLKANLDYVDDELALKDNIVDVDAKVLNLQSQIDDIIASEYYESITIGTITTLEPDQPAYVINSGTNINAILDFGIPRGYTGPKGDKGDSGSDGSDGKDGSDGRDGSDGSPGVDGSIAGGIAGGIAGTASGSVSGAAAGSSAATAIVNAHLAVVQPQISSLQTSVSGLQTQVDTLGQGMTQLDNDVVALKTKTQYMTTGAGITSINSTLNTNDINANNLYVANDLIVVDEIKASKFSGGILSTQIGGSNINIGTNETLINTINIGSTSTITTINGFVNYTNPFNNFFAQW